MMLEVIVSVLNDKATEKIKAKLHNGKTDSISITSLIVNGLSISQLSKCVTASSMTLSWDFGTEIIVLFRQMGINDNSNRTRNEYATLIRDQFKKRKVANSVPFIHRKEQEVSTHAIL